MTLIDAEHLPRWRTLVPGGAAEADLLAELAASDVRDASVLARLRRSWDADVLSVAIELVRGRAKAARKFPVAAATMAADVIGAEQATSALVAEHKARRFAEVFSGAPAPHVVDLCSGIGGDAMALAGVADVTACDVSPVRAWMSGHNAGCAARTVDVEVDTPRGDAFHLDPSRRTGAGRTWRYEDYRPGPAFIDALLASAPDGAVKLGPGVDLDALPGGGQREIEVVNERGTLVQTILWCGRLALHPGERTATRLPGGASLSAVPRPVRTPAADAFERYLLLIDPAVERTGLVAAAVEQTPARERHPGLGIFTADEAPPGPWITAHAVLAEMPWRVKRIRAWLTAHGAGVVTVKTRGGAVDADRAQRELRGTGDEAYVVYGLRAGAKKIAVVTRSEPARGT